MSALLTSTNAEYHSNRTHLSSSNLKMILKDIAQFKREWIDGIVEPELDRSYLVEGTLTHSLILEPKTVSKYAIYPGLRKAGKEWEAFKLAHAHRPIVSAVQMQRAEKLYRAFTAMSVATSLIQNGLAEHTMLGSIMGVGLKSRADYIVPGQYIVDVKTTSLPSGADFFAETIRQYEYDLSAALYTELANQVYGGVHDFYWMVLSKDDGQCHIYKAGQSLATGRLLMNSALARYKKCLASGIWEPEQPRQDFDTRDYEIQIL